MFSDCVARYLNPEKKKDKAERLTKKLKEQVKRFDLRGFAFPTPVSQTGVFENLNKISVMVLGWDDEKHRQKFETLSPNLNSGYTLKR